MQNAFAMRYGLAWVEHFCLSGPVPSADIAVATASIIVFRLESEAVETR